jgi:hypothetical protein
MVEPHTRKDSEDISYDILKSSKSWGVLPTPVDKIVAFSELMIDTRLDVSQIHHGYLSKASDTLLNALSKIRGIFDRSIKTIYLDLGQNESKKTFVKLHEVGHGVLPWQNCTTEFIDDDQTLSQDDQEQFENEANLFASTTLFQLGRFTDEISRLPFGIKSAMALARQFGGSNHATIRRYVEESRNRCSLLVLKDPSGFRQPVNCSKRDYFQSTKFAKEFGNISWPDRFGQQWPFSIDYHAGKRLLCENRVTLTTALGKVEFSYDFFNTTYNAFVLIYPLGEKNSGKANFVVTHENRITLFPV